MNDNYQHFLAEIDRDVVAIEAKYKEAASAADKQGLWMDYETALGLQTAARAVPPHQEDAVCVIAWCMRQLRHGNLGSHMMEWS